MNVPISTKKQWIIYCTYFIRSLIVTLAFDLLFSTPFNQQKNGSSACSIHRYSSCARSSSSQVLPLVGLSWIVSDFCLFSFLWGVSSCSTMAALPVSLTEMSLAWIVSLLPLDGVMTCVTVPLVLSGILSKKLLSGNPEKYSCNWTIHCINCKKFVYLYVPS